MFFMSEVDKGKDRCKRPETEPQKKLSARRVPEGHQSRATLDPLWSRSQEAHHRAACCGRTRSLLSEAGIAPRLVGRMRTPRRLWEGSSAQELWHSAHQAEKSDHRLQKLLISTNCNQESSRWQMTCSQRAKGRQSCFSKDPTSSLPPLGHKVSPNIHSKAILEMIKWEREASWETVEIFWKWLFKLWAQLDVWTLIFPPS